MTRRLRPLILLLAFGGLLVAGWAVLSTEVASPTAEQATPTSWTATFADIGADTDYLVAFDVDGLVDTTTITTYGLAFTTCDVVGNGLECRARLALGAEELTASIGVPDTAELDVTAIDIARQTRAFNEHDRCRALHVNRAAARRRVGRHRAGAQRDRATRHTQRAAVGGALLSLSNAVPEAAL